VAKAVGAVVVAVDLGPEKTEFLRQMGADYVVDAAASPDPLHKRIKKLVPKGTPPASPLLGFPLTPLGASLHLIGARGDDE
jgi:threonine dehydrogenase-like Zn-dependent dehydrogenase